MTIDTILLTGTIQMFGQSDHQIRSSTLRLQQYITNITKYIIDSPFSQIIFCENSNYNISNERKTLESLANLYNKKVELLQFQGDTLKTNQLGRGFGESEIIEYAINESRLLQKDQSFVKITGRYYLSNSYEFIGFNQKNNMFVRMSPMSPWCSTACYICTPNFYRINLWGVGNSVDDRKGKNYMLEGVFYQKLSQLKTDTFVPFKKLPKLQAITGSGYILESNYWIDGIKNILLSLGLYKI